MSTQGAKNLFMPLAKQWKAALTLARDHKEKLFGKDAEECMRLYTGDSNYPDSDEARTVLKSGSFDDCSAAFRYVYCIAAELVQVFGPAMYFRNPHRQVNPAETLDLSADLFVDPMLQMQAQQLGQQLQGMQPQDPNAPPDIRLQMAMASLSAQMQQIQQTLQGQQQQFQFLAMKEQAAYSQNKMRAQLIQRYLNYTPNELDLKQHSRDTIDEALIKGAGMLVTELYQPPESKMVLAGSFYRSINDLQLDPDATRDDEIMWAAIRCVEPVYEVARRRGISKETLKRGSLESGNHQASTASDDFKGKYDRRKGNTNDLLCYYKIYSKMGMGHRLRTAAERETQGSSLYEEYTKKSYPLYEQFGDYCYLEIANGVPFPLNMKPGIQDDPERLKESVQWPIPFWRDGDWPFTVLQFHKIPGQVWPMSHLRPAMAEIKFIQWCMSFLAQRVKNSCEDIVACSKAAGEDIKTAITKQTSSGIRVVDLQAALGKNIKDVISVFSFPQVNGDIWMMIAAVAEKLEKRLGLTELAYGMSARQYRSAEEAQTKQQNFSIRPDDMTQTVEEFETKIARKEALTIAFHADPQLDILPILGETGAALWERLVSNQEIDNLMRELTYRIEANSAKKPNQDRDAANIQQLFSSGLLQFFENVYMQSGNPKPYNAIMTRWCAATDTKTEGLLLEEQPPKPNPDEQKAQMEMQQMQAQMQMDQQKMQAEIQALMQKAGIEQQQFEQETANHQREFDLTMRQNEQEHALDMKTKMETSAMDLLAMRAKNVEQAKMARIKADQAKKNAATPGAKK